MIDRVLVFTLGQLVTTVICCLFTMFEADRMRHDYERRYAIQRSGRNGHGMVTYGTRTSCLLTVSIFVINFGLLFLIIGFSFKMKGLSFLALIMVFFQFILTFAQQYQMVKNSLRVVAMNGNSSTYGSEK